MKRLAFAALALAPQAVMAETPPLEILISAGRTAEPGLSVPAGFTIIDRRQIAASGAENLPELLRGTTGIQVTDGIGGGGSANIDMRGFGASAVSNVAVLLDGRKINSPTDASTLYLNSIDLDDIDRIEVIEGSAGTLYGNQAVGGLINIITRQPGTRRLTAGAGIGSYDSTTLGAEYSERLDNGLRVSISANRRQSDNYREHNASDVKRLSAQVGVEHGNGLTTLSATYLDDFQETPGALLATEIAADRRQVTADFVNDYFDTDSRVLRLGTQQQINTMWRFEGDLSTRRDRREFIQSFRSFGSGSVVSQDRDSVEFNPRLIGTLGNAATLIVGADLQRTDYLLVSAFGPQGNDQDIRAAYAQLQYDWDDSTSLTVGLRHARVDDDINNNGTAVNLDDDVTVGSIGLVHRPNRHLRLYARADQNYRFAKVDEHTNVVFTQPVGLDTQTGVSYEAGADWQTRQYQLKARVYRLNLENEISNDASNFLANVNLGRTRRIGGALSAQGRLSETLRGGVGYEYIDSEITSGPHTGSRVPLVAKHRANAFLQWKPRDDLMLRTELEYLDERIIGSDFANAWPRLDARTVVNLHGRYTINDWEFSLKINNAFNELYNESGARGFSATGFNPAPERNFMLSARYDFAG